MVWAVAFSFVLQIIVLYFPFMQGLFETTTLSLSNWLVVFFFAGIGFLLIEIKKIVVTERELKTGKLV
jgi:magnesium-transporting ATPase (P-type)